MNCEMGTAGEERLEITYLCKEHGYIIIPIGNSKYCSGKFEKIKNDNEMIVIIGGFINLDDYYDKTGSNNPTD